VGYALRRVCIAALPCVAMALYNTGHQVAAVLYDEELEGDWRAAGWRALGFDASEPGVLGGAVLGALYLVPVLLATGLAGGLVERGFARARGRRADHVALPAIALLLSLSLPAGVPLWHAALAAAVGIVLGKEIFGGLGRSFLSPVVVGLVFLAFAYPGAVRSESAWVPVEDHETRDVLSIASQQGSAGLEDEGISWRAAALGRVPGAMGQTSAAACGLGLLVLLFGGVASWRIVAGGVLGLAVGVLALQTLGAADPIATLPWHWHLVSGSFAFGLVFLATDPTASAATNPGRWLHGAMVGGFVAVVRIANGAYDDGVLLGLLMASVSAPLLDRAVAAALLGWNRRMRRG
jgi:Na+-transporting NADH:ubiquinone oxidoreductase subunit B